MKRTVLALLFATSAHAADWTTIRRVAQIGACAASLVDASTTLRAGLLETNPILGSGHPNAGRLIGLKLGGCALQIGYAEYAHRHGRSSEKLHAISAAGLAGVFSALAIHNRGLK